MNFGRHFCQEVENQCPRTPFYYRNRNSCLPSFLQPLIPPLSPSLLAFISANPVWQGAGVSKWFQVRGGFRNETVIDHRSLPLLFPPAKLCQVFLSEERVTNFIRPLIRPTYPHRRPAHPLSILSLSPRSGCSVPSLSC